MIEIDGKIVSDDILTECFACDISQCRGECCVEGDSGAPLDAGEAEILEAEFCRYRKYMAPEGIAAVEEQGFMVVDADGDCTTPLVDGAECAYSYRNGDGVTLCAIERAYLAGECGFRKPVSCHLYPIRLINFSNGTVGLDYHRWSICRPAGENGRRIGRPLYESLREPIVRRFGEEFYKALECAADMLNEIKTMKNEDK